MLRGWRKILVIGFAVAPAVAGQEAHEHGVPEKLGEVSFAVKCDAGVQAKFNRGVALLHSFAYGAAEEVFRGVAKEDARCAMAHWGTAMTHFHQLWEPAIPAGAGAEAQQEIGEALRIGTEDKRERGFIEAASFVFRDANSVPYLTRARNYEAAMAVIAAENKGDVESQVFYALALLANAPPADKTHARQKQAVDVLEPLYRAHPQHPGIAHYLIHACDNAELAPRGLPAARFYSTIAPSQPHALHMPSHIFTRLGLWDDSITSNTAARDKAHRLGDLGEELHAMDYLVYAYLQKGRDADAALVIQQLDGMEKLNTGDLKIGYSATAMPIRYAVERRQWADAAGIVSPPAATPQVEAITVWARGIGLARDGRAEDARKQAEAMQQLEEQLRSLGNDYWATQVRIMRNEVMAWSAQAEKHGDEAAALLRTAAEEEDAIEKLPVTPGPIVPAREQLGELLVEQGKADLAVQEFQTALVNAPGRRGALRGLEVAEHLQKRRGTGE
jgi:tetratricopeptide (TPR) repeat protein